MGKIHNPILRGFYPDPSVCRVNHTYFLAASSFAYAPGVPLFYSRDLMNWEQTGYILEREEQLHLEGAGMSQGIYAPCIRHEKGVFYMITTNVSGGGTFYVTAKKPEGPWSAPVYLKDAEGIDPSLFFENGRCYCVGQRTKKDALYFGDCEIWLQELDLENKRLTGEKYILWDGAFKHSIWTEGPRLYKRNGYYYLLTAEGGTEYGHSISIARSRSLWEGYEPCPYNPVFTHRNLGHQASVQNTGHGELIVTPDGDWYIFMLGTRPIEGYAPLGRETFIAEVVWENDWPVINPGEGKLRDVQKIKGKKVKTDQKKKNDYLFFRFPFKDIYTTDKKGNITLKILPRKFSDRHSPAYMGLRITSHRFGISTVMQFHSAGGEEAGVVYLYDEKNYIKCVVTKLSGIYQVQAVKVLRNHETLLYENQISAKKYHFVMFLDGLKLSCKVNGRKIFTKLDVREFTAESAGGFVGCTMGVYASADKDAGNKDNTVVFSRPAVLPVDCLCRSVTNSISTTIMKYGTNF